MKIERNAFSKYVLDLLVEQLAHYCEARFSFFKITTPPNDNNIVNICFKVRAKKDNGQMRAKRAENFRLRGGDQSHGGGGLKILGMGGG